MKASASKITIAMLLVLGIVSAYLALYPYVFSLAWPSLALSRLGMPHSWIVSAGLLVAGLVWIGLNSRRPPWSRTLLISAIPPAAYCAIAFWFAARFPASVPETTPYDAFPEQRTAYLEAFQSGYREGVLGIFRTYCFAPETPTRGFEDGAYQGRIVWNRMLGLSTPERGIDYSEPSASLDEVTIKTQ